MVIKGVNFWSFLFASQMAGWIMFLVDEVFSGWFGLFGLFPGLKSPEWIIQHQIDSTLFAIPFCSSCRLRQATRWRAYQRIDLRLWLARIRYCPFLYRNGRGFKVVSAYAGHSYGLPLSAPSDIRGCYRFPVQSSRKRLDEFDQG